MPKQNQVPNPFNSFDLTRLFNGYLPANDAANFAASSKLQIEYSRKLQTLSALKLDPKTDLNALPVPLSKLKRLFYYFRKINETVPTQVRVPYVAQQHQLQVPVVSLQDVSNRDLLDLINQGSLNKLLLAACRAYPSCAQLAVAHPRLRAMLPAEELNAISDRSRKKGKSLGGFYGAYLGFFKEGFPIFGNLVKKINKIGRRSRRARELTGFAHLALFIASPALFVLDLVFGSPIQSLINLVKGAKQGTENGEKYGVDYIKWAFHAGRGRKRKDDKYKAYAQILEKQTHHIPVIEIAALADKQDLTLKNQAHAGSIQKKPKEAKKKAGAQQLARLFAKTGMVLSKPVSSRRQNPLAACSRSHRKV